MWILFVVFFFLDIFWSVRVRNNENCVNFLELCKYQIVISIVKISLKDEIYFGLISPNFIFNVNKIYNTRNLTFILNWTQQQMQNDNTQQIYNNSISNF